MKTIILLSTLLLTSFLVQGQEECNNPFVTNKEILLPSPNILPGIGKHCNFLKYGSCCTEKYIKTDINPQFLELKTSLFLNYSQMVNHYGDMISRIATYNES